MPEVMPIEEGDMIVYARQDAGGDLTYPDETTGKNRAWRLVPDEKIIVGRDLPVDMCRGLIVAGICRVLICGK